MLVFQTGYAFRVGAGPSLDFCGCDSSSSLTGVLLPSVPSALLLACFWAAHTQPVRSRALEIPGGLTVGIHCVSLDCVENVAQSIVGAY